MRELCAVAGRWCLAAGCCCCCHRCCQPRSGRLCPAAPRSSPGDRPHRRGDGPVSWPGSLPGPWFWPECFRRLNVKGGQRPFSKETRSALDIEGKYVTIQGPSPDLTSSVSGLLGELAHVRQVKSPCLRCRPRVAVVPLSLPFHRARGGHEPLHPELAAQLAVSRG